ncbi:AcrR family transcriptional regulator [Oxalobacteraceae bacterium GrIS 2.11]
MNLESAPRRSYRGISKEDRRAERCVRLITAAIKTYGLMGFRQTSVKAVCAEAGLTERYFYESFNNSEELLLTAYGAVIEGLLRELTQAVEKVGGDKFERARVMLEAYFTLLRREPAAARLILIEIRGVSAATTNAYTAALHGVSQKLREVLSIPNGEAQQLLGLAVVGGISLIALDWIEQDYAPPIGVMVGTSLKLASCLLDVTANRKRLII